MYTFRDICIYTSTCIQVKKHSSDGTSVYCVSIFMWTMFTYHVLTWNWVLSHVITEAYISQCECQGLSISPVIVFTQTQRAKVGSKSAAGPGIQNAGEIRLTQEQMGNQWGGTWDHHKPSCADRAWLWSAGVQGMVCYMLCKPDIRQEDGSWFFPGVHGPLGKSRMSWNSSHIPGPLRLASYPTVQTENSHPSLCFRTSPLGLPGHGL